VTGHRRERIVVAAGGLGTRASAWSRYLPKEFYPVHGRPGIAWLLDEIAGLGPAEIVIIYHPYCDEFAVWARTALSRDGQDRYRRASGTAAEERARLVRELVPGVPPVRRVSRRAELMA
jgi:2-C-methyl-D-erythritol 4-phosphate cytidylyltransferase